MRFYHLLYCNFTDFADKHDFVIPTTVEILAGSTDVNIPVIIQNDNITEKNEKFCLDIRSANQFFAIEPSRVTVTIIDDGK